MDDEPNARGRDWWSAKAWLSRLAMSFWIIGLWLAWEGYTAMKGVHGPVPQWRIIVYFVAAGMAIALGTTGMRQRHRAQR
jgi:hypothetical protein